MAGESEEVCERGWRPADGAIGGRVATYSAGGFGAGVGDVRVCLAPAAQQRPFARRCRWLRHCARSRPWRVRNHSRVLVQGDHSTVSVVRQTGRSGLHRGRARQRHLQPPALERRQRRRAAAVGTGVADGAWHHVAMTWKQNTTNGMRSYLDGVLVEQKTHVVQQPAPDDDGSALHRLVTPRRHPRASSRRGRSTRCASGSAPARRPRSRPRCACRSRATRRASPPTTRSTRASARPGST